MVNQDEGGLPLSGLRGLDLPRILAGPYCTMILGDPRAEVVKVERPGTGNAPSLAATIPLQRLRHAATLG
jgi:crotonobetainyl-CoA:carnitine CoA-transferase CaiB-like acyl-CoA transferase